MAESNSQENSKPNGKFFDIDILSQFKKNNPHCEISVDEGSLIIEKPWGTDDTRLVFDSSMFDDLSDINNVVLNPQFDAIIHLDKNTIEFIFAFLPQDEEPFKSYIDREFEVFFNGKKMKCNFSEPTQRLYKIANSVRRIPTESGRMVVPQLKAFRDIQRLDRLPKRIAAFFENRVPRSFFITSELNISEIDIEAVCRHINFLTHYYDRKSPFITIRSEDADEQSLAPKPLRFFEVSFPRSLMINSIDDVILKLLEVARHSASRYAFLYLYQVIEYTAFYFVEDNAKNSLRTFLRDPTLINCSDEKIRQLMSILTGLQCNDDVKMRRVIQTYCDPGMLWKEIEIDKDFFSSTIDFNGGFELPALISSDTSSTAWSTMWMPKLYDHLTKLRNCLVHARERRMDKVILPTIQNNKKIARYLPLIRRLSEQLAICSISANSQSTSSCT